MTDALLFLIVVELGLILYLVWMRQPVASPPPLPPEPEKFAVDNIPYTSASGLSRVMRVQGMSIPARFKESYDSLTNQEKGEYDALAVLLATAQWTPCEFVRDYTPAWQSAQETLGVGLTLSDGTFVVGRSPR